jgi:hypothetical protein
MPKSQYKFEIIDSLISFIRENKDTNYHGHKRISKIRT